MSESETAAIVQLQEPQDGDNVWTVTQEEVDKTPAIEESDSTRSIDWSFGPLKYQGDINLETLEISVVQTITGLTVGPLNGNLKDGVNLHVNLYTTKGETRIYLKNGNEVWTHLDIKIVFNGHYSGDYKIITI